MNSRYSKYALFALLAVAFFAVQALAQVEEPPTNIAIIMDASGSMQALLEGGRSRITVAREEIIALSSQLSPTSNASLWVYGHRLSQDDPAASCLDIEEVIPLGPPDAEEFASTVSSVNAIGYTPIADTLGIAYSSLPASERDVIVLMSDGEESCGGDPCAIAAALDARNIELRIHTIGFAADAGTRAQLQCIADVTGGNYFEARDTEGLRQALRAATAPMTGTIAVVRSDGEIATGVGFTVTAGETVDIVVDFGAIQLVDANGTPTDTFPFYIFDVGGVEVFESVSTGFTNLPAGSYDVEVRTDPRLRVTVAVNAGETTDVMLPGLGTLEVVDSSGAPISDYRFQVIPEGGTGQTIYSNNGMVELLAGNYEVEVATNPPTRETVVITTGETTQIVLPGIGTIQLVDVDGNPSDDYVYYVYPTGTNDNIAYASGGSAQVAEGTYDVEVYTSPRIFETLTVTAGQITEVALPGISTIQIVDAEGNPIDESFYVYEAGTDDLVEASLGSAEIAAGTYDVEVYTTPRMFQTVTVNTGETTLIQLAGMGMIQIVDAEGNRTNESMYVYEADTDDLITTGLGSAEIAAGTYDVEVYTSPRTYFTVTVNTGETTLVQLGGTGIIQLVDTEGNPTDEYAFWLLDSESGDYIDLVSGGSIDMNAGEYGVEISTIPPTTLTVTVTGGETTEVMLPEIGTLQLVDAQGNPADEYGFWLIDPDSGDYIDLVGSGEAELVVGSYDIEITTEPPIVQSVTIEANEVTTVQIPGIGTIQLVDAQGNPTDADNMYVYIAGSNDYVFVHTGAADLPEGEYEVEFASQTGTRHPVTIVEDETTEISLPAAGK